VPGTEERRVGTTTWYAEKPKGIAGISASASLCTAAMPTTGLGARVLVDHTIDVTARPMGDAGGSPG
jgi:hypothetical protein